MLNFYIEQHASFGLGNFINCTPTIKKLYNEFKEPIPVLFRTDYVKKCYEKSPYIKIINQPTGRRLFGSDLVSPPTVLKPDWQYIQDIIYPDQTNVYDPLDSKPYSYSSFIDGQYNFDLPRKPYAVFVNGSGNEDPRYCDSKVLSNEIQEEILQNVRIPIYATGSLEDKRRTHQNFKGFYGDIQESIALIQNAEFMISNDTGFQHVGGVFKMKQLVIWKDTNRVTKRNTNFDHLVWNLRLQENEMTFSMVDWIRHAHTKLFVDHGNYQHYFTNQSPRGFDI